MSVPSSTPTENAPPVFAKGLAKTYPGGSIGLSGFDLEVGPGEIVALIGPNGSGKSTLLSVLAGSLRPDMGVVRIFGCNPGSARARTRTGFAEQEQALDPEMTIQETVWLFSKLQGISAAKISGNAYPGMEFFGLASHGHKRVSSLSGGLRQRLHLLLETLHSPDLLFLDEPTRGLDPGGKECFWRWLGRHAADGGSAVLSLHDLEEAERNSSRVVLLSCGRLREAGAPGELVRLHGHWALKAALVPPSPSDLQARLSTLAGVERIEAESERVCLWTENPITDLPGWVARLEKAGCTVASIERRRPDLASVYRKILGQHPTAGNGKDRDRIGRAPASRRPNAA